MGGRETNTGTSYQARVAAYVAAYILSRRRLPSWLGVLAAPTDLRLETKGGGDDLAIGFASAPTIEAQVKRGMRPGQLKSCLESFVEKLKDDELGLLVVDPTSSPQIREEFSDALKRWRDGMPLKVGSRLSDAVSPLLSENGQRLQGRLAVATIDVRSRESAHTQIAALVLEPAIASGSAVAAFHIMADDLHEAAGQGTRRDYSRLQEVLASAEIELLDEDSSAAGGNQTLLEMLERLLRRHQARAVLDLIPTLRQSDDEEFLAQVALAEASARMQLGNYELIDQSLPPALGHERTRVRAQVLAICARSERGEGETAASEIAEIALANHDSSTAWAAHIQFSADDVPNGTVPAALREHADIVTARAIRALRAGDATGAVELLSQLDAEASDEPDRLHLFAQCAHVLGLRDEAESESWLTRGFDAAARTTTILDGAESRLRDGATLLAGVLAEERGTSAVALEWYSRASGYRHSALPASLHRAELLLRLNRATDALSALASFEARDAHPAVHALRADANTALGDEKAAASELLRGLQALAAKHNSQNGIRLTLAALHAHRPDVAAEVLATFDENSDDRRMAVLRARTAAATDDTSSAAKHYTRAEELSGPADERGAVRFEHARLLYRAGLHDDALELLRDYDDAQKEGSAQLLVHLSMQQGLFREAEEAAKPYAEAEAPSEWALRAMAEVARVRDDHAGQAQWLERWLTAYESLEARLYLAQALADAGDLEKAKKHADLVEPNELPARDRAVFAHLLGRVGSVGPGRRAAVSAVRDDPLNTDIQLAVTQFSMLYDREAPPEVTVAAPGTGVVLQRDGEEPLRFLIASGDDVQPAIDELAREHALARAVLGKSVGDTVELQGPPVREVAAIEAVVDHDTYVYLWARERYMALNPSSPAIRRVRVPDNDLSNILAFAKSRREHLETVRSVYLAHRHAPLGLVAVAIDKTVAEAYDVVSLASENPRLWVEDAGFHELTPASLPTRCVLSLSAFRTLQLLGAFEIVAGLMELVVTTSVRSWLDDYVRRLETDLRDLPLSVDEKDGEAVGRRPDEDHLSRSLEQAKQLQEQVSICELLLRPHDWQRARTGDWEHVDPGSLESCLVARDASIPLVADDAGLRVLAWRTCSVPSLSVFGLVTLAHSEGRLAEPDFTRILRTLHSLGHWFVPLTRDVLSTALKEAGYQLNQELRTHLAHLGDPETQVEPAAGLVAFILRECLLQTLATPNKGELIDASLSALFHDRDGDQVARLLEAALRRQLVLVPARLEEALSLVARFRGRIP